MVDGLTGLAGLNGLTIDQPEATPEERYGGPANPAHAKPGEQARPYSWESQQTPAGSHGPYGAENQLLGDEMWFIEPAGMLTDDPTAEIAPWTRAAPFPRNPMGDGSIGPDNTVRQLEMSREIHSRKAGGKRNVQVPTMDAVQDHWAELEQNTPGNTQLQHLPAQVVTASGMWGTRDRTQSLAGQNGFDFDTAHQHRRYAVGSIPGNYLWMKPGGRPMAKTLPGPARPAIGGNSPFAGQDVGLAFGIQGAILQDTPTEYQPPPEPYLAPAPDYGEPGEVEFF